MRRFGGWIPVGLATLAAAVMATFYPEVADRRAIEQRRAFAAFVEWDDVARGAEEGETFSRFSDLARIPVAGVFVPVELADTPAVQELRGLNFLVVARLNNADGRLPAERSLKDGGAVAPTEDWVRENPGHFADLARVAWEAGGSFFLPDMTVRPLPPASLRPARGLIRRFHAPASAETADFHPGRWTARFWRAFRERGVRAGLVRRGASLSFEEFEAYLADLSIAFRRRGSPLASKFDRLSGRPSAFENGRASSARIGTALLLSILAPVLLTLWLVRSPVRSPAGAFLLVGALSLLTGVAVHALGSFPAAMEGLQRFRGVKLQLLAPFLFAALLLWPPREWRRFLEEPIRMRHAAVAAVVLMAGFLYVSRSGNHSILAAMPWEQSVRDWLDATLGARPRFKEAFLGHPLLLLGLFLLRRGDDPIRARIVLWAGLLGPVSVINTFTHFHTPIDVSMVRTLHGFWIGGVIGLLICYVYEWLASRDAGARSGRGPVSTPAPTLRGKRRISA